jgi:hypothetical protein
MRALLSRIYQKIKRRAPEGSKRAVFLNRGARSIVILRDEGPFTLGRKIGRRLRDSSKLKPVKKRSNIVPAVKRQALPRVGQVNYVTYHDMVDWSIEWTKALPRNIDVVVAIPKQGFVVAAIISTRLNKPLSSPNLIIQEVGWIGHNLVEVKAKGGVVLLVDESLDSGKTMAQFKDLISKAGYKVLTASLIVGPKVRPDYFYKIVPNPRVLECCIPHGKPFDSIAFDMDGVICEDPPPGVDGDEKRYREWIKHAPPYITPNYPIDIIISNRLECYREDTEAWLEKYDIKYSKLVLWDLPSKADREKYKWSDHKIGVLLNERPQLMYESEPTVAEDIWRATGIPTICISTGVCYSGTPEQRE